MLEDSQNNLRERTISIKAYNCSDLINDLNSETETFFNHSIYLENKTCIKINTFEDKKFEILIFNEKATELKYKVEITDSLIKQFCNNAKILNIVPGKHQNELIFFLSNGFIYSIDYSINPLDMTINFNNPIELLIIKNRLDLFLDSVLFMPLYFNDSFVGVVLSNDIRDDLESYWIFLLDDKKLIEIPFDANFVKIFPQTYNNSLSVLAIDENSIVIFQIESIINVNISDIVYEISLEVEIPLEIIDVSFNNKIISIWTKDNILRYSTEYGFFKDHTKYADEIKDIVTSLNEKFIIYIQDKGLFRSDLSTGNIIQPTLLDSTYAKFDLKFEGNINSVVLIDGLFFIISDDKNYYLFQFFEDKIPVYFVEKYKKLQKSFFDLLKNYPEELQQKYESAFRNYNEVYNLQLDSLSARSYIIYKPKSFLTKEMDKEILQHLHVDITYSDFANKFQKSELNFIIYVTNNFGSPRCKNHNKFLKKCENCRKSLDLWREKGLKIIESKNYRKSDLEHEIISYSSKIRKEFQLSESRRTLRLGFLYLIEMQNNIEISDELFEDAFKIYAECVKEKLTQGRSIKKFIVASIHTIFRVRKKIVPIKTLLEPLDIDRKGFYKTFKLIDKIILPKLRLKRQVSYPEDYLEVYIEKLKLSEKIKSLAIKLLQTANEKGYRISGKDPRGLAAGAIYICADIYGEKVTQIKICKCSRITEVTLRERKRELKKYLDFIQIDSDPILSEITFIDSEALEERPYRINLDNEKNNLVKKSQDANISGEINNSTIAPKILITTNNIIKILSNNWQDIRELIFKLRIIDEMDARYLQIKLKELERKEQVVVEIFNNKKHWRLKF